MSRTVGFIGGKYLIPHQGHVFAVITASTMVEELHVIVTYDTEYERNTLFTNAVIEHIPITIRLRWWRQITKDMPHVHVHAIEQKETGQFADWEDGAAKIRFAIKKNITHVFSSEHKYDVYFKALYPKAKHIVIDAERSTYNISATMLRTEGVMKHWNMIPDIIKPHFVKKVVVVGTESTGKSTLVRNLAKLYNTNYVEEFGRVFYEQLGDGVVDVSLPTDYAEIAMQHKLNEKKQAETANKVLFIDTEANVTQYYSRLYADHFDGIVDSIASRQDYDLWLFLEPDVEWVNDGTRTFGEHEVRKKNNELLKKMLDERGVEYISISGSYLDRVEKSMRHINELTK
jgi:HTH-type transcriptional repressor of NAD biosynthesis genes